MNIGKTIAMIRKHKGMTQQACACLAGMKQSVWCDVERDRHSPSIDTVERMLAAMGIDLAEQVARYVK